MQEGNLDRISDKKRILHTASADNERGKHVACSAHEMMRRGNNCRPDSWFMISSGASHKSISGASSLLKLVPSLSLEKSEIEMLLGTSHTGHVQRCKIESSRRGNQITRNEWKNARSCVLRDVRTYPWSIMFYSEVICNSQVVYPYKVHMAAGFCAENVCGESRARKVTLDQRTKIFDRLVNLKYITRAQGFKELFLLT